MFSERITSSAWWLSLPPWPKTTLPSPFPSLLSQPFSHYSTACGKSVRSEKIEVEIIFYSSSLQTDTPLPLPSWQLHCCHFGDHWLDQCHPQPESFAFNPWNSIILQVVAFGAIDASCYQMPELVSSTRSPFGQQWANIHVGSKIHWILNTTVTSNHFYRRDNWLGAEWRINPFL